MVKRKQTRKQKRIQTGRAGSVPNLQLTLVRTEAGRELQRAFAAAGETVATDYRELELRIAAVAGAVRRSEQTKP